MNYVAIIIITFISGVVGTGLGGVIGAILNGKSHKEVSLLLAFAAGVMFSVVCFDLMETSLSYLETINFTSIMMVCVTIILGYLVVWGLNILIDNYTNKEVNHVDNAHPKTADDLNELIHADHYQYHKENNTQLFVAGLVMMGAIALHNFPEGVVIGVSYAKEKDLLDVLFSSSGFIMAVIIGLHNIPEGMAVSVPLISGGMSKPKAVLLTALSGLPTVIGAVAGYLLGGLGTSALLVSLGLASGAMLYVILGELLPEAILMYKSKLPSLSSFIGILVGFILVNL